MTFPSPPLRLGSSAGAYCPMIAFASFTPAVFACGAYVAETVYAVETTPLRLAPFDAASCMNSRFAETLPTYVAFGDQPTFVAVTSAVIVGDGVAKITNVSAPAALSARICCARLVCVTSYDWALTTWLFFAPSPTRRPA